jgi:hypothetical protein
MTGMGLFRASGRSRRAAPSADDAEAVHDGPGGRFTDVLLVLDDLAALLDLVATADGELAEPAAERVQQLRRIRRDLQHPRDDGHALDYGREEWLVDLTWLLSNQDLSALYGRRIDARMQAQRPAAWPPPSRPGKGRRPSGQ